MVYQGNRTSSTTELISHQTIPSWKAHQESNLEIGRYLAYREQGVHQETNLSTYVIIVHGFGKSSKEMKFSGTSSTYITFSSSSFTFHHKLRHSYWELQIKVEHRERDMKGEGELGPRVMIRRGLGIYLYFLLYDRAGYGESDPNLRRISVKMLKHLTFKELA
ncbi:hypothetical protein NC653_022238 [Populus alba x Populus x berolinensis]|uniref:Uncharacterized protein n=1 Tax=Populus alba x Populus x berolinensis TaxID=444605 RepID=A0AAD6MF17_9ROSI|nr:hypothetical protein NC653_022238 [Populus alba x Populus x berolinensis]